MQSIYNIIGQFRFLIYRLKFLKFKKMILKSCPDDDGKGKRKKMKEYNEMTNISFALERLRRFILNMINASIDDLVSNARIE